MNNVNKLICKITEFLIYFLISLNKYFSKQIKNRKDQLDSYKSQISTDENHLQYDFHQQEPKKDRPRVIEQFFPHASILGSQLLVPDLSDDQKRLFMQLDFAEEQNIEDDRYHRTDVERQMKKHHHSVEEQPISNERSSFKDSEVHIIAQPSVEKPLSQIRKSPQSSIIIQTEGDEIIKSFSPVIESAESPHSSSTLVEL